MVDCAERDRRVALCLVSQNLLHCTSLLYSHLLFCCCVSNFVTLRICFTMMVKMFFMWETSGSNPECYTFYPIKVNQIKSGYYDIMIGIGRLTWLLGGDDPAAVLIVWVHAWVPWRRNSPAHTVCYDGGSTRCRQSENKTMFQVQLNL